MIPEHEIEEAVWTNPEVNSGPALVEAPHTLCLVYLHNAVSDALVQQPTAMFVQACVWISYELETQNNLWQRGQNKVKRLNYHTNIKRY